MMRKLVAGPEMDALVAVKIMGWREVRGGWRSPAGNVGELPPYSTDDALATEVAHHAGLIAYPAHSGSVAEGVCRAAVRPARPVPWWYSSGGAGSVGWTTSLICGLSIPKPRG
jgi:hypothetical protein